MRCMPGVFERESTDDCRAEWVFVRGRAGVEREGGSDDSVARGTDGGAAAMDEVERRGAGAYGARNGGGFAGWASGRGVL